MVHHRVMMLGAMATALFRFLDNLRISGNAPAGDFWFSGCRGSILAG
jgi:hypothetical protein